MAAAFPDTTDIPDDLTICGICHKTLANPKLLPCQHSCCVACMKENVKPPDFTFSCPTCERIVNVNRGDVEQLPDNYLFNMIQEQQAVPSDTHATCLLCEADNKETKATHQCLDCPDTFCSSCRKFHRFSSLSKHHKIAEIEDIKKGRHSDEMKQKKSKPCPKHSKPNEVVQLKFYCEDCQFLVCQHCVILDHKFHTCTTLDDLDEKMRPALRDTVNLLTDKQEKEAKFSDKLDGEEEVLNQEKGSIDNQIHEKAAELHDLVDKVKEQKLVKVKMHYNKERKAITEAKNKNQLNRKQTDAMKYFAEAFLDHSSKVDFVSHFKDVELRVKECIASKEDNTITTKHLAIKSKPIAEVKDIIEDVLGMISVEHTNIGHSKNDTTPKELCDPQIIFNVQSGMLSSQSGLSVTTNNEIVVAGGSEIGIFSNNGVAMRWITSHGLTNIGDVAVKDKRIYVIDILKRKVLVLDINGDVQKSIEMPQCEHGTRCTLYITVDDDNIMFISSFNTKTIYKCALRSTALEPVLSNSSNPGLTRPYTICVTPKQELIVSNDMSNNIQAYTINGQLLWHYNSKSVQSGSMEFSRPEGICSDREGNVYVCDFENNRIQVIKDGNFVAVIQPQGLVQPLAVDINSNNELVISHNGNKIMKVKIWK